MDGVFLKIVFGFTCSGIVSGQYCCQVGFGKLQVYQNVSIPTKVTLVIVQLVSRPTKVKCALKLTNAIPATENAMLMLIASMMLNHTAVHAMLDGILLMVVKLVSILMNVHSPLMMLFVTMPVATTLTDHSSVLASLATQVLHVLTTTNAKMVPMMMMKMHYL